MDTVPQHARNGYRHDEHYWEWLKARRFEWMKSHNASVDAYIAWIVKGSSHGAHS
jgi:hypothetical protein